MAVQPNEQQLRRLAHLKASEFKPLMDYLKDLRNEALEGLVSSPNERITARLQGKAELLKVLIENVENSDELIKKLQASAQAKTRPVQNPF